MSTRQIENAGHFLSETGYVPKLFNSPMEADCGLPKAYFDVVYSIYAIGWTVDLKTTFHNIAAYLKKDGIFIFSWDHPFLHCIDVQDNRLVLEGCYLKDEPFSYIQRGNPVTVQNRRLSTYINDLAAEGLMVERLVEETDHDTFARAAEFSSGYYTPYKAKIFPLSFVMKARKIADS